MHNYKRFMVALDFSQYDALLIRYVSFLSTIVKPAKIYFVHFMHVPEFPDVLKNKQAYTVADQLRQSMIQEVKKNFRNNGNVKIEYTVLEGAPVVEMLQWSAAKKIDLIVLGKKKVKQGTGLLAERIVRKAGCSVLLVPDAALHKIDQLFVASDFSENAVLALKAGWGLSQKQKAARLICYHAFHLPQGYYKSGVSEKEFQNAMLQYAREDYSKSLKAAKIPPDKVLPIFEMGTKQSAAAMINRAAHNQKSHLIIVGAKGRNGVATLFLGSVTEKLLRQEYTIPILVVKDKGKSFSFLDFINEI